MSWEAIGAIGQILGSIAVFVTLGYLAAQVRQARSEARRALSQGRGQAIRDLIGLQSDDRYVAGITKIASAFEGPKNAFVQILMEEAGLDFGEAHLVLAVQGGWWTYRMQIIPTVHELPEIERWEFDVGISLYGTHGPSGAYYKWKKPSTHPEAVRYIEDVLARGPMFR